MAALDAALAAARAGTGRLVVVDGAAGLGKSTVLAVAREHAGRAGMRVLSASGLELERDFAFGLALRLLEPPLAVLSPPEQDRLLSGPARGAAALFDGRTAGALADGVDHGAALVHALRTLTVRVAAAAGVRTPGAGLLITVDDGHWSDVSSLRLLIHLAGGIAAVPMAIVVSVRPGSPQAPTELLERLRAQPTAVLCQLDPLGEQAAAVLVAESYPQPAPEFITACARASGGNPFYLRELLEAALADGIRADPAGAGEVARLVPAAVLRMVLLRMGPLSGPARALASALAVLGDATPLRRAAALADLDAPTAEQAADALTAAHLTAPGDRLSFTHPLIGTAVHADLPALACSRAHRRAADLLRQEDAPAEVIAAHLLSCRPDGDADVVAFLVTAAGRAAGRGEYAAARRFLNRALAEPPPAPARVGLLVDLALTEAAIGAPDALARVTAVLPQVADAPRRARILQALARLCFSRSDFPGAAEAAEAALAELDPDDPLAAEVLADQLAIAGSQPAPGAETADRIHTILTAARAGRAPTDPGLLAQLAGWQLARGEPADQVRHTAAAALAALTAGPGQDRFYGIATGYAVVTLIQLDEPDLADAPIQAARRRAQDTGSLIGLGFASHWQAMLAYHRGMLADAVRAVDQTLQICRAGWDVCRGWVIPILAHAHLDLGNLDAAIAALHLADDLDDRRPEYAYTLAARGRLALVQGDARAALDDLTAAGAVADRHGITQPTLLAWRSTAALAAAHLGRPDYAAELAHVELDQARRIGARRTLGVALRAAGLVIGGTEGAALLAEAVAVLEHSPATLERARALVDLGAARRRAGQRVASRPALQRGLDVAEHLGAAPLANYAHAELRAAGGRRGQPRQAAGPAALTGTERRVAELAAEGLPTPHIARTLYVSPKTIEWHLGNVYRKLDVHSRHQLAQIIETSQV